VGWLLQIKKRVTKVVGLFEQIETLVDSLYISKHFPNEMRVMRFHILSLLHCKHFIVDAEHQMLELGLIALLARVEFD
jgi:hypothetical protein